MVEYLLQNGADVYAEDKYGNNSMTLAYIYLQHRDDYKEDMSLPWSKYIGSFLLDSDEGFYVKEELVFLFGEQYISKEQNALKKIDVDFYQCLDDHGFRKGERETFADKRRWKGCWYARGKYSIE